MNYKENTIYVGYSDRAQLQLNFEDFYASLKMGEDGRYAAHIITDLDLVPDHYYLVADGYTYLEIVDDKGPVVRLYGEKILVYRAGLRGILIATVTVEEWNAKGRA